MRIAIGDVHGHYDALTRLLSRLGDEGIDFGRDQLVFLGDLVDGGCETRQVIELVMELEQRYPQTVALLGNHEDLLLNAYDDPGEWLLWYTQGGRETLNSYVPERVPRDADPWARWQEHELRHFTQPAMANLIPAEHIAWLRARPLMHETASFIFVHGGVNPRCATPADTSRQDMLWIRNPFIHSDRDWGKRVIFGHTYQRNGPLVMPNKIGIDTMARSGGFLTAAVLDDAAPGEVRFSR